MYKNRIDYSTCQYQQPESVELHYSAKYHLENAVKQVTDFRHMSDVIINQAYNISDQHEKAYLSRKQVDATAKKTYIARFFVTQDLFGRLYSGVLPCCLELSNILIRKRCLKQKQSKIPILKSHALMI